jgi:thiol:disulfide interchange protein
MARPVVTSRPTSAATTAPVVPVSGAIPFDAHDVAPEVAAASAGGRPVAMYFLATWCGYCRKMETQTLKTAAVQAEMANWYDVQVNPDSPAGRALAAKYTTGAYPTVVVFDTRGNVRGTIVGCQDPAMFETRLRAAR